MNEQSLLDQPVEQIARLRLRHGQQARHLWHGETQARHRQKLTAQAAEVGIDRCIQGRHGGILSPAMIRHLRGFVTTYASEVPGTQTVTPHVACEIPAI
jgi:hypothetical protein